MTVLGVCGIVYGALGLFGAVYATWRAIELSNMFPLSLVSVGTLLLGYAVSAGIVVASVGILNLQPWARTGLVWYSAMALVWQGLSIAIVALVTIPVMLGARVDWMTGAALGDSLIAAVLSIPQVVLLSAGLHFLRRPHVRRAFDEGA